MDLLKSAMEIRKRAYAPYSGFKVGAAIRGADGGLFLGCNVENIAYPEGCCAEAGAISAMIAAGETRIAEIAVVADSPQPVTPCGGCRQKIAEFAAKDVPVIMANLEGTILRATLAELLPGGFGSDHFAPDSK